jgi:hypothetical protein
MSTAPPRKGQWRNIWKDDFDRKFLNWKSDIVLTTFATLASHYTAYYQNENPWFENVADIFFLHITHKNSSHFSLITLSMGSSKLHIKSNIQTYYIYLRMIYCYWMTYVHTLHMCEVVYTYFVGNNKKNHI